MNSAVSPGNYGTTRVRSASVSYAEIEAVARSLMANGRYPSGGAVRRELKRGSSTTIAEAMQRFWKNQAALNAGDPIALTRLPPELADAAVELWEKALRLSQQTTTSADNGARQRLEELRREADSRVRSVELREKEWDLAARVRERALSDAREQLTVLVGELAASRAELRSLERQNSDLSSLVDQLREQITNLIAKAVARHQSRTRRTIDAARSRSAERRTLHKRRLQKKPPPRQSSRGQPGSTTTSAKRKRASRR